MRYQQYLKNQITRAESKWARKPHYNDIFKANLLTAWKSAKDLLGDPKEICCMGVRDGTEMFEFKNYYRKATVWGVDITKNIFTIRLIPGVKVELKDFNDLPKEWVNKFDLVFSNSLDHAFDPIKTVEEWYRVCKGCMFLELSTTRDNLIEHNFADDNLDTLFPPKLFERLKTWETPDRNIVSVVVKVIK